MTKKINAYRWLHALLLLTLFAVVPGCGEGMIQMEGYLASQTRALSTDPVPAIDTSQYSQNITDQQMKCLQDNGIRHVIVGTQTEQYTLEQLDKIQGCGTMTMDAYVFIHWNRSTAQQVQNSLAMVQKYPIGRFWLDVEEDPGSLNTAQLEAKIQEGLDACNGFPCGIYTGKWWWDDNMSDGGHGSTAFSHYPLWASIYTDHSSSLDTWENVAFGGWASLTGKQYTDTSYLCGVNMEYDTMYIGAAPGEAGTPEPPKQLDPNGGESFADSSITLSCQGVSGATQYRFEVDYRDGTVFKFDSTLDADSNSVAFTPTRSDATYRFRVRALNDVGWGLWSDWATFNYLKVKPGANPPLQAPTGLAPDNGAKEPIGGVTLSCDAITGATGYDFEIWYGTDKYFYTYQTAKNTQTFYPGYQDVTYTWRARAKNAGGAGLWSRWANFFYGHVSDPGNNPPGGNNPPVNTGTPAAPTGLNPDGDAAFASGSAVTLTCGSISGATSYEFDIQFKNGSSFQSYYNYTNSSASQTFWPQYNNAAYRWQVRAKNSAGWGSFSAWATFNTGTASGSNPPAGGGNNPPANSGTPDAPTGLSPDGGAAFASGSSVTLTCGSIAGASSYQFDIQYNNGSSFQPYYTYTSSKASLTFWPQNNNTTYQWRVRAENSAGWGSYSGWATFNFGSVSGSNPPAGGNNPPASGTPAAPTGLSPDNGQVFTTSSVTLTCGSVAGASSYQFDIEYNNGSSFQPYYTYTSSTASQTFWPQNHGKDYRFQVRAQNASGWGDWSSWATFHFN